MGKLEEGLKRAKQEVINECSFSLALVLNKYLKKWLGLSKSALPMFLAQINALDALFFSVICSSFISIKTVKILRIALYLLSDRPFLLGPDHPSSYTDEPPQPPG